ncbi:fibronectin type III domain-containing protein [Kineococcus sp. SYSU DK018]|uniref:fibronectin type III domain-containing protein n=1 Tax=Kineococcus sp. SYSU DK018 TaxID=3383139 RepID=UPI003D7EE4EE
MRFKVAIAAVCAAGSVLGPAQGAAAAGADTGTVTGTVRRAVVEVDPALASGGHDVQVTVVQTANGPVRVPASDLADVPTGATVTVRLGRTVRAADRSPAAVAESGRAVLDHEVLAAPRELKAASTAVRAVLPVLVTVPGVAADGTTAATLASSVAEVSSFYDRQTHGAVTYAAQPARTATITSTAANSCDLATVERAVRAQVAVPADTTLLVHTPKVAACGFSGVAWIGSTAARNLAAWINGSAAPAVVAHEIGHNLGLGHSGSSAACSGGDDGTAAACSTVEYGDFFDVMGANAYAATSRTPHLGEMNAAQRDRLAGLTPAELTAVDAAARTSTVLHPVGSASGTRALRFTSGGATYYVELRAGAGRDAPLYPGGEYYGTTADGSLGWAAIPSGVTVRRLDGTTAGAKSRLLEPRAAGAPFVLPAGATFTTADGRTTVTAGSVSASSATVTVAPRTTTTAPAPTPTATPTATPTTAPGAPAVTGAKAGDRSATFTATTTATGGSPITGYLVTPYVNGVAQSARTLAVSSSKVTVTVTGLVNGRTYTFGVRARNSAGYGPQTTTARLTPRAGTTTVTVPRALRSTSRTS